MVECDAATSVVVPSRDQCVEHHGRFLSSSSQDRPHGGVSEHGRGIQESFETITIKQDPEDSKNIGSIYWDDWWCGVDVGILYMNNRPVGKP
jgi:hypothetical protein